MMEGINWKRVLPRAWMVLGLLWLIFSSSYASLNIQKYLEGHADHLGWSSGTEFYLAQASYVFLPPIILPVLGLVGLRIMKGIKSNNPN